MTPNSSNLQDMVMGEFALSQVLSVFLFLFLLSSIVSLVKYFIPEKIDGGYKLTALLGASVSIAFFSYFTVVTPETDLFLNLMACLTMGICLLHPTLALSNMVAYLVLRPWELLEKPHLSVLPRTFLLLFLISVVINFFQTSRVRINTNKEQILIVLLGLWVFISTIFSGDAADSQAFFFDQYLKAIMVAVFIFQTIRTENDYKVFTNSLVLAVLGISIFALINTFYITESPRLIGRGAMSNANDLAALLIFALPLSLRSVFKGKLAVPAWVVSGIIISVLALGVFKAQSRASYISVMLMGMTYFVYHFRYRKVLLMQMALVAVVGFIVISNSSLGRDSSDLDESKLNRIGYWQAGWSMALRHPLLGVGFNQFPKNYALYGAADFTEQGDRTAHSSWVLILSEAGFPALILLAVLLYHAAKRAWSLFDDAPELLLMLVGYGICMTFLSHTYTLYPYILLALIFTYPKPTHEARHENTLA